MMYICKFIQVLSCMSAPAIAIYLLDQNKSNLLVLQTTPASWLCWQTPKLWTWWGHSDSLDSFPEQFTSLTKIGPDPASNISVIWPVKEVRCKQIQKGGQTKLIVGNTRLYLCNSRSSTDLLVLRPPVLNPSSLHITVASCISHRSLHTVPQTPYWQISTLPLLLEFLPTSRTSPSWHSTTCMMRYHRLTQ